MAYPPIADLVPHGDPIRAVEELVDWTPAKATCRLTVRPATAFVKDGAAPGVAMLEWLAQAVAACLGYEAYTSGVGVRVGMLIGVRSMELHAATVPVGAELLLTVERNRGNDDVSTFHGEARCGDELLAEARMTVFHAEKPPT
jgi:predicted hotdog family 3-hydroxylacyl-ACP dehydratase